MDAAAQADAGEDAAFGRDKSGEEMPAWVGDKKRRAEKIRAAKARVARPEAKPPPRPSGKREPRPDQKREARRPARNPEDPAARPSEDPDPKAQKNFTDPESRIMKTKDGFTPGLQRPGGGGRQAQVIVADGLEANGSDQHQLDDGRRR